LLGVFWTARGYESFDGDQAYRLPLLLARQNPAVFARDPFVRAFDAFNPHVGWLWLLDLVSRPLGLAASLAALFVFTYAAMTVGILKISRSISTVRGSGFVAIALFLAARAGNIGTNHLVESMVLDRQIALAAGWLAIAIWICSKPSWRGHVLAAGCLAFAGLIHPSLGLQLAMVCAVSGVAWTFGWRSTDFDRRSLVNLLGGCLLGALPSLGFAAGSAATLTRGLALDEFRALAVEIQGPQHLAPWLWRFDQWSAALAYLALAIVAIRERSVASRDAASAGLGRLALMLGCLVAGLGAAWVGVAMVRDFRLTLFQPFRMATLARGVCLLLIAPRIARQWQERTIFARMRAASIVLGLVSDQAFVAVAGAEVLATLAQWTIGDRSRIVWFGAIGVGMRHLAFHDTQPSAWILGAGLAVVAIWSVMDRLRPIEWNARRCVMVSVAAWTVPILAVFGGLNGMERGGPPAWAKSLVARCRFVECPTDEVERLGVWARGHLAGDAMIVGPPGEKTFRLWSRRSVAFNRAASPYHASALGLWADQFKRHVGFEGSSRAFAAAYLRDRQSLEARFDRLSVGQLRSLMETERGTHLLALSPGERAKRGLPSIGGVFAALRIDGRYAIYEVVVGLSAEPGGGVMLGRSARDSF
jgi:hypothetical protein